MLIAAAALVGCGSSVSSTAPSHTTAASHTTGLPHTLVLRTDAICRQANERIAAVKTPPAINDGAPYGYVVRLLQDELPVLTAEVSALQRLAPSGGDQEAFREYVRDAAGELAAVGDIRDASVTKDSSAYSRAALELVTQTTRLKQAADHLGLVECAKTPQPQG
jgi:hypothetical protein